MKFTDCSFSECKIFDYDCKVCPHFDKDGISDFKQVIHPILNVPMSEVLDFEKEFVQLSEDFNLSDSSFVEVPKDSVFLPLIFED